MHLRCLAAVLLLTLSPLAQAYSFLVGYDEAPTVAKALERVSAQPDKHVLLYFGMSQYCPPCVEARAILNSDAVRDKWRPNYIVVNIDLYAPTPAEREVINQVRVSWAPVLVFLDHNGRRVAFSKQIRSPTDALLLNEFVSQRQYAMSAVARYGAVNLDSGAASRLASEARAVKGDERIDDRPRLRDVLAQNPERLTGAELKKAMAGKVMHKENQDWYLVLVLDKNSNAMRASGRRKDGKGDMRGAGKWYVTKKGKLCLELTAGGVDENWCRHVFRVGEGYYVSKDLRPDRLVYRFVLDNT
jgi:thiol-disulfide isomerase/thioredoxin